MDRPSLSEPTPVIEAEIRADPIELCRSEEAEVYPVPGDPKRFRVRCREWFYEVFTGDETHTPRCECRHWVMKLQGTRRLCRHLKAALYCPACQGTGIKQVPVVNLITDRWHMEDRPCGECIGDGSRAAYLDVQALKAEWQARHHEAA